MCKLLGHGHGGASCSGWREGEQIFTGGWRWSGSDHLELHIEPLDASNPTSTIGQAPDLLLAALVRLGALCEKAAEQLVKLHPKRSEGELAESAESAELQVDLCLKP